MSKKYINTILNVALYIEKNQKFAYGSRRQKDCSFGVIVKWWKGELFEIRKL